MGHSGTVAVRRVIIPVPLSIPVPIPALGGLGRPPTLCFPPSPVLPLSLCPDGPTVLLPLPHNPEPRSPDPLSPVSAAPIPAASTALALGRRVLLGRSRQQVVE